MAVDMELIKQLKEKTGAGLMDCKKALEETNGDLDKAVSILREKGFKTAEKKAEREAKEGVIYVDVRENEGIILEVNCETDFVARNEEFRSFVKKVGDYISSKKIQNVDENLESLRKEAVMKFGENILIKRWNLIHLTDGNVFDVYQHGDKIGVVVEGKIDQNDQNAKALLHDISLQVAAMSPSVVKQEDLDPSFVEEKKKEFTQEFVSLGKPQNIAEKAAMGKLAKIFSEMCLYDQIFVKDEKGEKRVYDVINEYKKSFGKDFEVIRFYRFQLGE